MGVARRLFNNFANMDYEHPFVQEVRNNPRDDFPRLIFADYLDEAGDPRGELIRVQVQLANMTPGEPERRELELREEELLADYADAWLEPLREFGAQGLSVRCLQRGLIERVRITAAAWLENAAELCRVAPALHCVELRALPTELRQLMATELPEQITSVDLSSNRIERIHGQDLLGVSSWPDRLQELSLAFNRIHMDDLVSLRVRCWRKLKRLDLSMNKISALGIERAAMAGPEPTFPELKTLLLVGNPLKDDGLRQVFEALDSPELEELDLAASEITSVGVRWLVDRLLLGKLKKLSLRGNRLNRARYGGAVPTNDVLQGDLETIAQQPSLTQLDLRATGASYLSAAAQEKLSAGLKC